MINIYCGDCPKGKPNPPWLGSVGLIRDGNSGDRGFTVVRFVRVRGHSIRIPSQTTDILFRYSDPVAFKCKLGHHFVLGYNEFLAMEKWTQAHSSEKFYLRDSSVFEPSF